VVEAACFLLTEMIEEGDELASVIIGEDAKKEKHDFILDLLADKGLEAEVIDGGQPVYQYIFGVE
jgi:dihydroxyacetone kinase-like predicted kinase